MSEFVFPFKFEDILEETTDSRYCVPIPLIFLTFPGPNQGQRRERR